MTVFLSILLCILLLDIILICSLAVGLRRLPLLSHKASVHERPVTLLVPFRNEEQHLTSLIHDLRVQSYPQHLLEVVFIDDHSEDGSLELLRELIRDLPQFRCIALPEAETGKKKALSMGVSHASHPWIIQTDADCRLGARFIEAHLSCKEETGADLVAGMVTSGAVKQSLLEGLERLDLLSLTGASAGSFYWGRPLMCSGANLAYSRPLYEDTRRFEPVSGVASGDDMFLMIGTRKLGKKLAYLTSKDALVHTHPAASLGALIRQRSRWAAKTPYYHQGDIEAVALLTMLAHLSLLMMPWLLLSDPFNWPWVASAILAKGGADFALLYIIAGYTGQRRVLRLFIPVFLIYYPYQILIWIGSLWRKNPWKGRK